MSQAIKNTLKSRSPSVYAAGLFALLAMTALPATAQVIQREPPPAGSDGGMTGKQLTPEDKGAGTPRAQDDKSSAEVPNTKVKQLSRVPQTADEKAKLLSDLYAHLQTAEDEAAAKKVTEAIERLWQFSGSDTVNLLMQRSTKAIKEKKNALALKLLDRLAELAPDYPEVFNQRAYYHFTQNNYEAAAGDLRRVLAMDPNHYKALEGLAQIWRETGNKKGAYKVMQQLLEVHPFSAGAKQIHDELKKEVDGQGI